MTRLKRKLMLPMLGGLLCLGGFAQPDSMPVVDPAAAQAVLARTAATFPKFDRELKQVQLEDKLIRQVIFVRPESMDRGPAFAAPGGVIHIDLSYLEHPRPGFDDDRMVVVLYHEIGHLHYFVTVPRAEWTPENSEKAAFEYSLKKTQELAERGDCGPLKTGVRFMKLRSKSDHLADPHVRALKRMVNEPLYAGYVDYVAKKCAVTP